MFSTPLRVYRTSGANPKTTGRCFGDYTHIEKMKDSARYAKIVEWSEEDHCYVGSAPGLIYGERRDLEGVNRRGQVSV